MICYLGKTFCKFEDCKNFGKSCHESFTKEVKESAEKWWGSPEVPVAFYLEKPNCFEEKADGKNKK